MNGMEESEEKRIAGKLLSEVEFTLKDVCDKGFESPLWFKLIFLGFLPLVLFSFWKSVLSFQYLTPSVVISICIVLLSSIGYEAVLLIYLLDQKYKFLPKRPQRIN